MARRNSFLEGIQAFNAAYDTVNNVAKDFELSRVMSQKPEAVDNYAAPEGYTNVQDAMANFKEGDSVVAPGLTPQRQTTFMGKIYDGDMTPEKLNGLRYRAAADVVGKYDPIKGIGMQREIMRDERDAEKHSWDQKLQPTRQRTAELQVKGLERTDTSEENKVKLAEEERGFATRFQDLYKNKDSSPQAMEAWVQAVSPYVGAMHKYNGDQNNYFVDPVTGMVRGVPRDGDKAFSVDPTAALPLVMQMRRMSSQFGGDPMVAADAINRMTEAERKKFLEADDRAYGRAKDNAKLSGDKETRDETKRYHSGSLANDAARTGMMREQHNRPDLMQLFDDKGNMVLYDKRSMKPGADGTVTLPTGLRPPKLPQELTEAKKAGLTAYYKALENFDPKAPQGQLDALAAKFGVADVIGAGRGGMSWGATSVATDGRASASAPSQSFRPLPKQDITKRGSGEAIGSPENFERVSQRGMLGGLSYVYRDPLSGKTFSIDEYNRMLNGK